MLETENVQYARKKKAGSLTFHPKDDDPPLDGDQNPRGLFLFTFLRFCVIVEIEIAV